MKGHQQNPAFHGGANEVELQILVSYSSGKPEAGFREHRARKVKNHKEKGGGKSLEKE